MPIAEDPDSDVDTGHAPDLEIPNAADPKRLARIRDKAKREAEEARILWSSILRNQIGRRELWRILELGHAFEERFAVDGIREKTWILAGEQRLAWRLFRLWEGYDFEGVALMRRENDPALKP